MKRLFHFVGLLVFLNSCSISSNKKLMIETWLTDEPLTSDGGCDQCLGAVTIDGNQVKRNSGYYSVAHASKFVRPGSVRIASNMIKELANVAFKTPDGKKVLVVLNESNKPQVFKIVNGEQVAVESLNGGAVATYVW